MSSEDTRALVASEAAWLARVNDDRVRVWFKDPNYPSTSDGAPRRTTTWDELAEYCARQRKRPPLPLGFLDIDPAAAQELLSSAQLPTQPSRSAISRGSAEQMDMNLGAESGTEQQMRLELAAARVREDGLRRALREQLAASAHMQDQAAAQRRALTALVDSAEELSRLDQ